MACPAAQALLSRVQAVPCAGASALAIEVPLVNLASSRAEEKFLFLNFCWIAI